MGVVVISHAADLDGIACAALIMRKYGITAKSAVFMDYDRESVLRGERQFRKLFKRGATLFITDLSAESTPDIFLRIVTHAKRMRGRVFWFDHHTWSKRHIGSIALRCDAAVVGENGRFCASEITARELGLRDKYTAGLLRTVHAADFALKPKNARMKLIIKAYALGLSYFRMKGGAVFLDKVAGISESISIGSALPGFLKRASDAFEKLNESRLKAMLATVVNGGVISVAFTPVVSTNDACAMIIRQTGSDIGCYVDTDNNRAHLRSIRNDCSILARRFGGGGHPRASAFDISMAYDLRSARSRRELADSIIGAARRLY
ncbi:MAG: hypothetical protein M1321_00870 [Candidatus Marsarchaeota archaeon]|nr:hypothetical protein [Candidatus Marsarchaeota archaeon]